MQQPNWYEIRSLSTNPERRAYHTSFVAENKIYVFGGEDSHEGIRASMHSIDLSFLGTVPN